MKNCWHTICFTYKDKIKSKFFILSTVIFILLIAIAMNYSKIQKAFTSEGKVTKSTQIIVNNLSGSYIIESKWLEEWFKDDSILMIKDKNKAETELNKGIDSILLRIEDDPKSIYKISILTKRHSNSNSIPLLQEYSKKLALNSKLHGFNVQAEMYESLLKDVKMEVVNFETNAESKMALAYFIILAFMILLNFYVQGVANIIAYEKNSRVIEVLLTSSKPGELFFGKVLGNCFATLTQISIVGIVSWLINTVSDVEPIKMMGTKLDISLLTTKQIVYVCILFVLGYLLYSLAAGALASLVTSSEDVGQLTLPVNICFIGGVGFAFYFIINSYSPYIGIASQIPLISPPIMAARIIMFDIPDKLVVLNFSLTLLFIFIISIIGSKIYSNGILSGSNKMAVKKIYSNLFKVRRG